MLEINEIEKKEIIEKLNKKFKGDFSFLEKYRIFKNSDKKYFIFNGKYIINGERIGLEAFKDDMNRIRLTFQFANLFKEKIKDFFLEVDEKNAKKFLNGEDLNLEEILKLNKGVELMDKEFYLIKHKGEFLGNVKVIKNQNLLKNYLGKQYRFKNIVL